MTFVVVRGALSEGRCSLQPATFVSRDARPKADTYAAFLAACDAAAAWAGAPARLEETDGREYVESGAAHLP